MKNTLLSALMINIMLAGFSLAGWEHTYGGIYEDKGYSVIQTSDGNYVVTGYTFPPAQ